MHIVTRTFGAAIASLVLAATARAQCPAGAICTFGTDVTGSNVTRATNVNSAAARAAFLASLVGVGTESFEGLSGSAPLTLTFPGAGTATLTGGESDQIMTIGSGTNGYGRYPTSGSNYYETTSASGGGTTFSVQFGSPVAAFGFYGVDVGEFGSQLSLRFTLVGGGTQLWALPYVATYGTNSPRDGAILYAGFINTAQFTQVDFLGTSSDDVFAFDDMTIGSREQVLATPEPATLGLLGAGLATLALAARRRRMLRA